MQNQIQHEAAIGLERQQTAPPITPELAQKLAKYVLDNAIQVALRGRDQKPVWVVNGAACPFCGCTAIGIDEDEGGALAGGQRLHRLWSQRASNRSRP